MNEAITEPEVAAEEKRAKLPTLWHDGGPRPRHRLQGLQFARCIDKAGRPAFRVIDVVGGVRRVHQVETRRAAVDLYNALAKERMRGKRVTPTAAEERALELWRAYLIEREERGLPDVSFLEAVKKVVRAARASDKQAVTFSQGVDLYIEDLERLGRRRHHIASTRAWLLRLARHLAPEGEKEKPLELLTVDQAADALAAVYAEKEDMAPRTQQAISTAAGAMWSYLVDTGRISGESPWRVAFRRVGRQASKKRPQKERTDAASLQAMLAWTWRTHRSMLPALVIAAFCGLRPSEIWRLSWQRVILERGEQAVIIGGSDTKTDASARKVKLPKAACAWLRAWGGRPKKKVLHVIPGASEDDRRRAWTSLLQGVKKHCPPRIISDMDAPAAPAGAWVRDLLRHSFGSYKLAISGSLEETAASMGNSVLVCRSHYAQQVRRAEAVAWFNVMPPEETPEETE